jgi:integrase
MAKATRVKTRYPGIYRVGDRYEWRTRTARGMADTLDEARKAKAKAEVNGPVPAAVRGSFGEYARDWIVAYQGRTSRGFAESTRQRYRESLELYAIPYFDEIRKLKVSAIRRQHVKAFIAWLSSAPVEGQPGAGRRPLSAETVKRTLAPMRAMFADAVEDDLLPTNPATVRVNVAPQSVDPDDDNPNGKARPFTDAQLDAVMDAVPDDRLLMFDVLSATGIRWGEFSELRGRDLVTTAAGPCLRIQRAYSDKFRDANGKRTGITKHPKSDFGCRDLPLDPELARRLWRLQRKPRELLFTNRDGERLDYSNTRRRVLMPILKAASATDAGDVMWAGFHTFRHTLASRMFADDPNAKRVQRWLGHHKASFTLDTYTHLLNDDLGAPLPLRGKGRGGQQGANSGPETTGNAADARNVENG